MKFRDFLLNEEASDVLKERGLLMDQIKRIMSRSSLCSKSTIMKTFDVIQFEYEEEDVRAENVLVHVRFTFDDPNNNNVSAKIWFTIWEGRQNKTISLDDGIKYIKTLGELEQTNSFEPLDVALVKLYKTFETLDKLKVQNNKKDFEKYFKMKF